MSRDFRAWACRIARLNALSLFRDRQRDRHVFNEELLLHPKTEAPADRLRDRKHKALVFCHLQSALRALRASVREGSVSETSGFGLKLASEAEAHKSRHQRQRESLENCLQKLPEAQRELVLPAYTKGNRMDELANQRAQTPMSRHKILHRTRLKLLECIQRNFNRETLA